MRIASLELVRTPHTPIVVDGLALALEPPPAPGAAPRPAEGTVVLGACRVPAARVPGPRGELLRAVFLTISGGAGPFVFTKNLVGDRVVYEDDVEVMDDDLSLAFRCDLVTADFLPGPLVLHASALHLVSNFLWIP